MLINEARLRTTNGSIKSGNIFSPLNQLTVHLQPKLEEKVTSMITNKKEKQEIQHK